MMNTRDQVIKSLNQALALNQSQLDKREGVASQLEFNINALETTLSMINKNQPLEMIQVFVDISSEKPPIPKKTPMSSRLYVQGQYEAWSVIKKILG